MGRSSYPVVAPETPSLLTLDALERRIVLTLLRMMWHQAKKEGRRHRMESIACLGKTIRFTPLGAASCSRNDASCVARNDSGHHRIYEDCCEGKERYLNDKNRRIVRRPRIRTEPVDMHNASLIVAPSSPA